MIRLCLFLAVLLSSTSCVATSSLGKAQVLVKDGTPCFKADENGDVHVSAVVVSDPSQMEGPKDWRALAKTMWSIRAEPLGSTIKLSGTDCIKYGDSPASTKSQISAQKLELQKAYSITIGGKPVVSSANHLGYDATFCLYRAGETSEISATTWDRAKNGWIDSACLATAPK